MAGKSKKRFKVWRASPKTEAGFMTTETEAVMSGGKGNFFASDRNGNYISGPVSFVTTGEQVRRAGLFVEQNDFIKMLPSTLVTPIPPQIPAPPVALFASIAKTMPTLMGLTVI